MQEVNRSSLVEIISTLYLVFSWERGEVAGVADGSKIPRLSYLFVRRQAELRLVYARTLYVAAYTFKSGFRSR